MLAANTASRLVLTSEPAIRVGAVLIGRNAVLKTTTEMTFARKYRERAIDFSQRIALKFLPEDAAARYRAELRRDAFVTIEKERRWGEQASGSGSTLQATENAREIVARIVGDYQIKSILDVPCGDFEWMPLVLRAIGPDVSYVGGDIVPALIARNTAAANSAQCTFKVVDFVSDPLPVCDLIVCRDALQHLPVEAIKTALRNFSASGARYLLASTHLRRVGWKNHRENRVGKCRDRNLLLAPFNLPDPIVIYGERGQDHKFLALWKLPLAE